MIEKLPVLLHISISLLDHYLQIVQEQAGTLLIHLIHALAREDPKANESQMFLTTLASEEVLGVIKNSN